MRRTARLALAAIVLAGCAAPAGPSDEAVRRRTQTVVAEMFAGGSPSLQSRVKQDDLQAICSEYQNDPPAKVAAEIQHGQAETVKFPASGGLMGDWKRGQRIANTNYGMRFRDPPGRPNGANCYGCHALAPSEVASGTLGPSLYLYGRKNGTTIAVQRQTYIRIYNPQAIEACTAMPRFGHNGILTEQQITDLVALLLDPDSPVNK